MTAAASSASSRGDWAWPLKAPLPTSSPPLELQFLPPSSAEAVSTEMRTTTASPWSVDPSRLQKLMMGSVAAPSSSPPALVPAICTRSTQGPDFGAFFAPGSNKALPSGWERCLDLESGEVFIKKCDVKACRAGPLLEHFRHHPTWCKDRKQVCARLGQASEGGVQTEEQRLDWSPRWAQGKPAIPIQDLRSNSISFMKMESQTDSPDGQPLCLDLDLRLTSDNRSQLVGEASDMVCLRSAKPVSSMQGTLDVSLHSKVQLWEWQQMAQSNEGPASIQEMVRESTMATAVCSKCSMYVLLKKSNPTCPRCSDPIILECGVQPPPTVTKRPRLELSPDDLSLSTDSSR